MTDAPSAEARRRVADLVALQPTKNAELQQRWDMADGSEVHRYLESELEPYYYRDEESRIRATTAALELVGDPDDQDGETTVQIPRLQSQLLEVLAGPDERSASVVSVLHSFRAAGYDADVDTVRTGLRSLADKGLVEVVQRTVPTFRLAAPREELDVSVLPDSNADTPEP